MRRIAEASTTGHGTNIIAGIGVGLESTAAPVLVISGAIVAAYWCGQTSGVVDQRTGEPIGGLFGTAVATMGMLSTAACVWKDVAPEQQPFSRRSVRGRQDMALTCVRLPAVAR